MNEDKSPIDSFAVSLGQTPSKGSSAPTAGGRPWRVLVCSDFGFRSDGPERVRIAEWNEFMASRAITIAGTAPNLLSGDSRPVYVEMNVASMKDLSAAAMQAKIGAFSGYAAFLDTLARFLDGRASREEVTAALRGASLSEPENQRMLAMLGAKNPRADGNRRTAPAAPTTAVASILSMMDIGGAPSDAPPTQPHSAVDGLLRSITGGDDVAVDKAACAAYLETGKKNLAAQLTAIQAQPFFQGKKAAWECLYQCAKAIGRKREIELSVFSAGFDDRDAVLEKLAQDYDSGGTSWDLILWDYPVPLTNAEMDRTTGLTRLADRCKSVVLAPLDPADRLFESIETLEDFSPVFQDIRFLPFKKLREALESRALCLCSPDMKVLRAEKTDASFTAHCGWPVLIRWVEMTLDDLDPFATRSRHAASAVLTPESARFHPSIPAPLSDEAASIAGLTLLSGAPADVSIDRTRTVIDPEVAGTAYSSLAFNLLVNRVAKLAGEVIIESSSSTDAAGLCRGVEECLRKELAACGICSEPDQVSVKPENGSALLISLNSDASVGGHEARFSFSLGG
jgi:hypothetical protein